jgi:diguanylate cyclase (GGDEF)-like protein
LAVFIAADAGGGLKLVVRRQALTVNINEIPLVLALFYLPPITVLVVRLLAAVVSLRRMRATPDRVAFNVASRAAATSMANLVIYQYPLHGSVGPREWLILFAAVGTSTLTTLIGLCSVVGAVESLRAAVDTLRAAVPGLAVAAINVTVGLVVLIALQSTPWTLVLLVLLAAALVVVYRALARFLVQRKTLSEMYDLSRLIASGSYSGNLPDLLLSRMRELLQAESATMWLTAHGRHPEVLLSARIEHRGLLDVAQTPDRLRQRVLDSGDYLLLTTKQGDSDGRAELRRAGVRDAMIVPLRSSSVVIGTIEVANRIGQGNTFTLTDLRLLETIAAQAAVAVDNSRLVERLRFDAYHDGLTGLPNRRRILGALEEAVKVRAPGEVVAVLLVDVADMREVNESLGHSAGDTLLAEMAQRLRALAAPGALVGRIGSDEFAITLRVGDSDEAVAAATALRTALQEPLAIGSLTIDVDAAVGVAVYPDHATEAADLLQRADVAVHSAKSSPTGVQAFHLGMVSRSVRRLGLAADLRRALDAGELEVYFQPQVRLRDRHLIGVECLARWEHPAHGSVSPEDFVAVAEHTGQIGRLTEVVLREGLRRGRDWDGSGRPLNIAVNIAPRALLDPALPELVGSLLTEYQVAPQRLTLEIKEDGLVGAADRPLPGLRALADLGVRLSVDDFGTGYSSLSHLRRLPVQEVKIDKSVIQGVATDPDDLAIVRAVVDLARHFGLAVVAEGVESELTLTRLDEIGCDSAQGFYFSRPLAYDRLDAWFAAHTESEPLPSGDEVRRLRAVR